MNNSSGNAKGPCLPCAAKLRFYGREEASSQPCIAVLCDKEVVRKVRRLLSKKVIKDQIYAKSDSLLPSFDILVEERPPRRFNHGESSSLEVMIKVNGLQSSVCGSRLRCSAQGKTSTATLGGIIEVQRNSQSFYYGLTVAHIISGGDSQGNDSGESGESCSSSAGWSDEEYESALLHDDISDFAACETCKIGRMPCSLERRPLVAGMPCLQCRSSGALCEATTSTHQSNTRRAITQLSREGLKRRHKSADWQSSTSEQSVRDAYPRNGAQKRSLHGFETHRRAEPTESEDQDWKPFGLIFSTGANLNEQPSLEKPGAADMDWALIQPYDENFLMPNEFIDLRGNHSRSTIWKTSSLRASLTRPSQHKVSVVYQNRNTCAATLSSTPTFILLPPSNTFVEAYAMRTLDGGSESFLGSEIGYLLTLQVWNRVTVERGFSELQTTSYLGWFVQKTRMATSMFCQSNRSLNKLRSIYRPIKCRFRRRSRRKMPKQCYQPRASAKAELRRRPHKPEPDHRKPLHMSMPNKKSNEPEWKDRLSTSTQNSFIAS